MRCTFSSPARPSLAAAIAAVLVALAGPASAACEAGSGVPAGRIAALARGFNLPGWLDTTEFRRPDPALLAEMRAAGMTHIRLPVAGELVMPAFSDRQTIARHLAELDRALAELLALGFVVSVDMHPGGPFQDLHRADPDAALAALEDGWRRLAVVVGAFPPDAVFAELLNEPVAPPEVWEPQARQLLKMLRRELPETTLIVGSAIFQRVDVLSSVVPTEDANVVHAVHFYDPMVFTHQGQDWFPDDPMAAMRAVPFPADLATPALDAEVTRLRADGDEEAATAILDWYAEPWNRDTIAAIFAEAGDWSRANDRAVIVNEFGVLNFVAPPADRAAWLSAVAGAAEDACLGWTHWDFQDGFGIIDPATGEPDPAIMDALLGPARQ
jgi:endoglucanase